MSSLAAKPLADVKKYVADSIKTLQKAGSTDMLHLALSINEYLKDAERFHCIRDNLGGVPELASPQAVIKYVDNLRGVM